MMRRGDNNNNETTKQQPHPHYVEQENDGETHEYQVLTATSARTKNHICACLGWHHYVTLCDIMIMWGKVGDYSICSWFLYHHHNNKMLQSVWEVVVWQVSVVRFMIKEGKVLKTIIWLFLEQDCFNCSKATRASTRRGNVTSAVCWWYYYPLLTSLLGLCRYELRLTRVVIVRTPPPPATKRRGE